MRCFVGSIEPLGRQSFVSRAWWIYSAQPILRDALHTPPINFGQECTCSLKYEIYCLHHFWLGTRHPTTVWPTTLNVHFMNYLVSCTKYVAEFIWCRTDLLAWYVEERCDLKNLII